MASNPLQGPYIASLLQAYVTGFEDPGLRDELVERLNLMMQPTILKYFGHGVNDDRVSQAGIEGVRQALDSLDSQSIHRFWLVLNQHVVRRIRELYLEES